MKGSVNTWQTGLYCVTKEGYYATNPSLCLLKHTILGRRVTTRAGHTGASVYTKGYEQRQSICNGGSYFDDVTLSDSIYMINRARTP